MRLPMEDPPIQSAFPRTPLAVALIAIAVILVVVGSAPPHALKARRSRSLCGHPPDETGWLLVLGAASGVAGLATISMPRRLR